jgi:hypothetical protein
MSEIMGVELAIRRTVGQLSTDDVKSEGIMDNSCKTNPEYGRLD